MQWRSFRESSGVRKARIFAGSARPPLFGVFDLVLQYAVLGCQTSDDFIRGMTTSDHIDDLAAQRLVHLAETHNQRLQFLVVDGARVQASRS